MKSIFKLIIFSLILFSCGVPQNKYDELLVERDSLLVVATENKELIEKNEELKESLSNLRENFDKVWKEKFELERDKNSKIVIYDSDALNYLKDHYEFYDSDKIYRNPKLRRIDSNQFVISLEECDKKFSDREFFWTSVVKELIVNNDKTYTLKTKI
ncbi:hypothetical protein V8G69_01695 [Gaetbulibacter sp. M235]|uniref:hypothetical protein n=1 Tax=Gaetbulibacter sp. M235 TaxID=3126510 RepID=UPI00374F74AC